MALTKNWYKSKTIWSAIGFMALAFWHYHKSGEIEKTIELLLLATSLLGIRTAWQKIG